MNLKMVMTFPQKTRCIYIADKFFLEGPHNQRNLLFQATGKSEAKELKIEARKTKNFCKKK